MKPTHGLALSGLIAASLSSWAGCSIINAYNDDIVVLPATGAGGAAGSVAEAGDDADVSVGEGGTSVVDAATDSPITVDADAAAGPRGAIVVSGLEVSDSGAEPARVLSVLDPMTGKELSREHIDVVAAVYDGDREDFWYIFEQVPGSVLAPAKVHVRQLNNATGKWTEKTVTTMLPPPDSDEFAVLNHRLAYLSPYKDDAGLPAKGLALLSTDLVEQAQPVKLVSGAGPLLLLPFRVFGVIGTPSPGGAGGNVDLVRGDTCALDAMARNICNAQLDRVTIGPTGPSQPQANGGDLVGPFNPFQGTEGKFAWAPDRTTSNDVLAVPPLDITMANATGYIRSFSPLNAAHAAATDPRTFGPVGGPQLRSLAIAECERIALTVEFITKSALFAVPFDPTGTPTSTSLLLAGQRVLYEPFTHTVLAPFFDGSSSFEFRAFTLGGGDNSKPILTPTLTARGPTSKVPWAPPADLIPDRVAVKAPLKPACGQ